MRGIEEVSLYILKNLPHSNEQTKQNVLQQNIDQENISRVFVGNQSSSIVAKVGNRVGIDYHFRLVIPASSVDAKQVQVLGLRPFVIEEADLTSVQNSVSKKFTFVNYSYGSTKGLLSFGGTLNNEIVSGAHTPLSITEVSSRRENGSIRKCC